MGGEGKGREELILSHGWDVCHRVNIILFSSSCFISCLTVPARRLLLASRLMACYAVFRQCQSLESLIFDGCMSSRVNVLAFDLTLLWLWLWLFCL